MAVEKTRRAVAAERQERKHEYLSVPEDVAVKATDKLRGPIETSSLTAAEENIRNALKRTVGEGTMTQIADLPPLAHTAGALRAPEVAFHHGEIRRAEDAPC
jgi:hypothetical protein